ncbi:MAG: fumarylacetoacetate hydrolase family protein [Bacillota bacterium]
MAVLGRFALDGKIIYGQINGEWVIELNNLFERQPTGCRYRLADLRVLAPCEPTKAVCVGLNYLDHIGEFGPRQVPEEPVLFIKPATAVIGPEQSIIIPEQSQRVDYEAELAVIIGRTCRQVSPADALDYVLGYTCANDVTARDLQQKDGQWTRAKSFDTFLPLGPYIITDIEPAGLSVRTYVNGKLKQQGNTENMIFSISKLISFISSVMTLLPGDVILTGTPAGVGPLQRGDVVEVVIQPLGILRNNVR